MPNFYQLVEFESVPRDGATINLPSPVAVHSGQQWNDDATYERGVPGATAWDYLFFDTEEHAREAVTGLNNGTIDRQPGANPNNPAIDGHLSSGIPTNVVFTPSTPATQGTNLKVNIAMTFPDITTPTSYFMVLGIIQA